MAGRKKSTEQPTRQSGSFADITQELWEAVPSPHKVTAGGRTKTDRVLGATLAVGIVFATTSCDPEPEECPAGTVDVRPELAARMIAFKEAPIEARPGLMLSVDDIPLEESPQANAEAAATIKNFSPIGTEPTIEDRHRGFDEWSTGARAQKWLKDVDDFQRWGSDGKRWLNGELPYYESLRAVVEDGLFDHPGFWERRSLRQSGRSDRYFVAWLITQQKPWLVAGMVVEGPSWFWSDRPFSPSLDVTNPKWCSAPRVADLSEPVREPPAGPLPTSPTRPADSLGGVTVGEPFSRSAEYSCSESGHTCTRDGTLAGLAGTFYVTLCDGITARTTFFQAQVDSSVADAALATLQRTMEGWSASAPRTQSHDGVAETSVEMVAPDGRQRRLDITPGIAGLDDGLNPVSTKLVTLRADSLGPCP